MFSRLTSVSRNSWEARSKHKWEYFHKGKAKVNMCLKSRSAGIKCPKKSKETTERNTVNHGETN